MVPKRVNVSSSRGHPVYTLPQSTPVPPANQACWQLLWTHTVSCCINLKQLLHYRCKKIFFCILKGHCEKKLKNFLTYKVKYTFNRILLWAIFLWGGGWVVKMTQEKIWFSLYTTMILSALKNYLKWHFQFNWPQLFIIMLISDKPMVFIFDGTLKPVAHKGTMVFL